MLLKPGGVITMEFPHLLRLIDENQFDTIYHEHFSYLSLLTVERGSSRRTGCGCSTSRSCRRTAGRCASSPATTTSTASRDRSGVAELRAREDGRRVSSNVETYRGFGAQVQTTKRRAARLPDRRSRTSGRAIVGYGAAGQGQHAAQLLRRSAPTSSTTPSTATRTSRATSCRARTSRSARPSDPRDRPDYVLILPWNLKDEIMEQLAFIRDWGGPSWCGCPSSTMLS